MIFKKIIPTLGLAMTLAAVNPAVAHAADPVSLNGDVQVDRVVVENGQSKHVLQAPTKVIPGDHLVFTTTYRNAGIKPIENFVVTNPVPAAVIVADEGDAATALSVDGGAHWGKLSQLKVADGKGGFRPAELMDVTHLRWTVKLIEPGTSGSLQYRAMVR